MGQQVAYNWVPPTVLDHTPQKVFYANMLHDERVTLAKKLYAEAGFGPDHPLKFTVNYPTNEDARTELLAAMQMWKNALGVEMTMESEEFQIYLQRLKRGDDEMTLLGWSEEIRDPSLFLDRFVTGGFGNYFQYSNPAVDDLEKMGAATMNPAKRRDIYEKVERLITDDIPGIPSYFNSIVMVVNPRLKGWVDDNQYPQSRWLGKQRGKVTQHPG
jgi:oligopeptide transport system substrate-binding protein